jgi:hypothetical protein
MPGLSLTLPQATHLWHVDRESCTTALDRLVGAGFLREDHGAYLRTDSRHRVE